MVSVGLAIHDQKFEIVLEYIEYALLNVFVYDIDDSKRAKIMNFFKVSRKLTIK